ncbi:MAG: S-layer homology domain-containing protein [Lachnospirales bacterium]
MKKNVPLILSGILASNSMLFFYNDFDENKKSISVSNNITVSESYTSSSSVKSSGVASFKGVTYDTLQEAIKVADDSDYIYLLKDFDIDVTGLSGDIFSINKNIKINGKNPDIADDTVKNITLTNGSYAKMNSVINIGEGCNVELSNFNINGAQFVKNGVYVNENATLTINWANIKDCVAGAGINISGGEVYATGLFTASGGSGIHLTKGTNGKEPKYVLYSGYMETYPDDKFGGSRIWADDLSESLNEDWKKWVETPNQIWEITEDNTTTPYRWVWDNVKYTYSLDLINGSTTYVDAIANDKFASDVDGFDVVKDTAIDIEADDLSSNDLEFEHWVVSAKGGSADDYVFENYESANTKFTLKSLYSGTDVTVKAYYTDEGKPIITLPSGTSYDEEIALGDTYTLPSATVTDNVDTDLTYKVTINGEEVTDTTSYKPSEVGTYTIVYSAVDGANKDTDNTVAKSEPNSAEEITITLTVKDKTAPIITLPSGTSYDEEITIGDTYTLPSATVTDNVDTDLTYKVTINGEEVTDTTSYKPSEVGTYTIVYSAIDSAKNEAEVVTITLTVVEEEILDTEKPVITLPSGTSYDEEITIGDTYTLPSATVTDNVDTDLTYKVTINGEEVTDTESYKPSEVGTYTIVYSAIDSAKNEAEVVTITLTVVEEDTDTDTDTDSGDNSSNSGGSGSNNNSDSDNDDDDDDDSDNDNAVVDIPKDDLENIGGSGDNYIDINIDDLGTVSFTDNGIDAIVNTNANTDDIIISLSKTDNSFTLEISDGERVMKNVGDGVKVHIPNLRDGDVLVQIDEFGNQNIVEKSLIENGNVYALVDGSGTYKIIYNAKPFDDVYEGDWYNSKVDFVSSHELFIGVEENIFAPNLPMSRAMLTQVFMRLDDGQNHSDTTQFNDVSQEAWYFDSVNWAVQSGVVNGNLNGEFKPDDNITREELALMLYNYSVYANLDVKDYEPIEFYDASDISPWASKAMDWAISYGILEGHDNVVRPKASATRAEVATVMERFVRIMVK